MATYDERQLEGREVYEKLVRRIAEVVPPGINHWEPAFEIDDGPCAAFMLALSALEADPSDRTMARVTAAYGRVIEAWRVAAAEYSAEKSEA